MLRPQLVDPGSHFCFICVAITRRPEFGAPGRGGYFANGMEICVSFRFVSGKNRAS